MSNFQQYKRTNIAEMRPYKKGEDMSGISVSDVDNPIDDIGMVARNPNNHDDRWYVARQYFEDNFAPISNSNKRLNKGDKIKHDNKTWECICEDEEIAVLGLDFGDSVSYEFVICVSNVEMDDGFEYEVV